MALTRISNNFERKGLNERELVIKQTPFIRYPAIAKEGIEQKGVIDGRIENRQIHLKIPL